MKKILFMLLLVYAFTLSLVSPSPAATTVSVCNMPPAATISIRVYNLTNAATEVAWTSTGVTTHTTVNYKCGYYSAALTAGHAYEVCWQTDLTPNGETCEVFDEIFTASAPQIILPVMQGSIYTATATQSREVQIIRGDTPRITFDLGASYTGWTAHFGAKTLPSDSAYVIALKDAVWTDAAAGEGYVDLTAAETGSVGKLYAEIEIRNGDQRLTAIKFKLTIREDVIR